MDYYIILENTWTIFLTIFPILISGLIGYFLGAAKSFRDEKQKAYGEILPPIIKFAYDPDRSDEKEFNRSLSKLWLYGSKDVTIKMEEALAILHHPEKRNITKALQKVIVAMRDDIQLSFLQRLKPEEVNHIFTKIAEKK